ncbi:MAG: hypothetical protein K7J46_14085 [Bryobacter sp.]|jgi:hypothetical protein|nr:hypothetical protein [Bryobacter sp. CoA8 C33]
MHLQQAGVDITMVALWLGYESPASTHIHVEADMAMKEKALKLVEPAKMKATMRYRPTGGLLGFLRRL